MCDFSKGLLAEYYGIGSHPDSTENFAISKDSNLVFEDESDDEQSKSEQKNKEDVLVPNDEVYENSILEQNSQPDLPQQSETDSESLNDQSNDIETESIEIENPKDNEISIQHSDVTAEIPKHVSSMTPSDSNCIECKMVKTDQECKPTVETSAKHEKLKYEKVNWREYSLENNEYLDLSKYGLNTFPIELLNKLSSIKMLYLEDNELTNLPEDFFTQLRHLEWFDVRKNQLKYLPKTIKDHKFLYTMLLGSNKIEELPVELGLVKNLRQLQVADNPLLFPPKNIIELGVTAIKNFLREEWNKDHPEEFIDVLLTGAELQPKSSTFLCYKEKPLVIRHLNHKITNKPEPKSVNARRWNYRINNRSKPHKDDILLCNSCIKNLEAPFKSSITSITTDSTKLLMPALTAFKV